MLKDNEQESTADKASKQKRRASRSTNGTVDKAARRESLRSAFNNDLTERSADRMTLGKQAQGKTTKTRPNERESSAEDQTQKPEATNEQARVIRSSTAKKSHSSSASPELTTSEG